MSTARTIGTNSLSAVLGAGLLAFLQANGPQIIAAVTGEPAPKSSLEKCEDRRDAERSEYLADSKACWEARDVNKDRWHGCREELAACRGLPQ